MFLAYGEGGGDSDGVALFAVLHEGRHIDGGADVGVDGAAEQLKRVSVHRCELDLTGFLVEGLVDAGMEDNVVQTHLTRHAARHLTFALQQDGFNVVQD